jgi:hypothetical protein
VAIRLPWVAPADEGGTMTRFEHALAVMVAVATVGTGAGAVMGDAAGYNRPWQKALGARSEALNQQYGLGHRADARAQEQGWQYALRVRSEARNERYDLGDGAR